MKSCTEPAMDWDWTKKKGADNIRKKKTCYPVSFLFFAAVADSGKKQKQQQKTKTPKQTQHGNTQEKVKW